MGFFPWFYGEEKEISENVIKAHWFAVEGFLSGKVIWNWKKRSQTPFTHWIILQKHWHRTENVNHHNRRSLDKYSIPTETWAEKHLLLPANWRLTHLFCAGFLECKISIPTRATPFKRKISIRKLNLVQIWQNCALGKKSAWLLRVSD